MYFSPFCNWSTSTAKKYEIFFTCRVIFHRVLCKSFLSLTWNFIRLTFDTNMLLFFSACPDIVWMLFFWRERKKCVYNAEYVLSLLRTQSFLFIKEEEWVWERKSTAQWFWFAVHLKSVYILPVWMRMKFRWITMYKKSQHIFQTNFTADFIILSACMYVYCNVTLLTDGWYSKRDWTSENDGAIEIGGGERW